MSIVFCHNVYDRPVTLNDTMKLELELFPDCDQIIVVNNDDFVPVKKYNATWVSYPKSGHKLGCLNGLIKAMKSVSKSYDAIIFSHDDVHLDRNHIDVVIRNIELIKTGTDCIYRHPSTEYGKDYAMMECLFMSSKFAGILAKKELMKNDKMIPRDTRKRSISPEVWLANLIIFNNYLPSVGLNPVKIDFSLTGDYNDQLGNTMGYHHKNIGKRFWKDPDVDQTV